MLPGGAHLRAGAPSPTRARRSNRSPLYVSNAWDVPAPCRVVAATSSLWNVVLSRRPRLIRNFSAHAQGLAPLVAMDFWSVRTVVEDGHHFWRSWFHFDGRYRVHPLAVPIYQDAVLSVSVMRTLRAQFVQLRRWAWGASDVAYVIDKGWGTPNAVPGATWQPSSPGCWWGTSCGRPGRCCSPPPRCWLWRLPVEQAAPPGALAAVVGLKVVALAGLGLGVGVSLRLLPPRPARHPRRRWSSMVLQWTCCRSRAWPTARPPP